MQEKTAMTVYQPTMCLARTKGKDYVLSTGMGQELVLKRNQDFGKHGKAKKPNLLKAGAEKVIWAYGMRSVFTVEQAIEDYSTEGGFFFYRVRCDLYWGDQLITTGYGCANSRETACGFATSYDVANSRLKIARKRAMVDAALMVGQLSDMFSQDEDNDDFMKGADEVVKNMPSGPNDPISAKQIKRLYALAGQAGMSTETAKVYIQSMGYTSSKDIKQKDYDALCEQIKNGGK